MIQIRINNKNKQKSEFNIEDIINIEKIVQLETKKQFIIDLQGIKSITTAGLNKLKDIAKINNLFLCNIESDIYAIINLLKYDKVFHIFLDKENCLNRKNEIKNRQFKIV